MATVGFGIKYIKGLEDYKHYYHTESPGNIGVDWKGLHIELAIPLHGQHVDAVSSESLGMTEKLGTRYILMFQYPPSLHIIIPLTAQ